MTTIGLGHGGKIMFKNETKTRMMAMAVVAMFMLTAFSVVLAEDSDATEYNNASYTINMKVGDTFTYSPTANLEGTTFSWAKTSGDDLITGATAFTPAASVNGTTFTFTPAASGDMTVRLTASWTGEGSITQSAYQDLIFNVVNRLTVTQSSSSGGSSAAVTDSASASSASASVSLTEGFSTAQTYTFTVSGGQSPTFSAAPTIKKGDDASTAITTNYNTSGTSTITVTVPVGTVAGTYTVLMPTSFTISGTSGSSTTATQTKNLTLTITIAPGMTISQDGPFYTVIGDSDYEDLEFTMTNTNAVTTSTIVWNNDATGDSGWATSGMGQTYFENNTQATSNDKLTYTITLPITATYTNSLIASQSATVNFTVSATATGNGGAAVSTSKDFTLTVYWDLKFTSTPVMNGEDVRTFNSSANGLSVLMSTNVQGAKKVVYDWGDGKSNVQDVTTGVDNFLTTSHTYAKAGTYLIQVTASNDFGDTTVITPYSTGDDVTVTEPCVVTILDGKDAAKTVGSITVSKDSTFAIKDIVINEHYDMSKKKIVNLYTAPAGDDGKFNAETLWKSTDKVTADKTLYAEIEDKSATENFFDEHGWLFIAFIVLAILALVAYFRFGIQHPVVLVAAGVFVIFAILCFVHKDFAGIWDAITGIFNKE